MMMVYYFSFALIFLFLVVNVSQYINISKSQRFIRKEMQVTLTGERRNRLIVLIPVMDEYKIINETIMYFNRILSSHPNSLLVFVTTQKEGRVEENKTYQKILPYLSEETLIIHYPFLSGNKAHQINYAVERLGRMQKMGGGQPTMACLMQILGRILEDLIMLLRVSRKQTCIKCCRCIRPILMSFLFLAKRPPFFKRAG